MSISRFTPRRRTRAEYDTIPIKDPDIFYIVLETDETFSLYLGEEPLKNNGVEIDNVTIVSNNESKIKVSDDLKIDGGAF